MPLALPTDHRLRGWLLAAGVTAVAAALRLPGLGRPPTLVFDETYYVKDAWTLLQEGYEAQWPEEPNPAFESGDVDSYLDRASYVVHPQVGKWLIALGLRVLGAQDAVGWRLSSAVAGILLVLVVTRVGRRLMGSDLLGAAAGLVVALDGVAIVHARTGLLDGFLALLVTMAFGALLIDRDAARARLATWAADRGRDPLGPRLGPRWWRLVAGLLLGLACGVKWSGLWFLAAFGLLSVGWDLAARRRAGVRRWLAGTAWRDAFPAFASVVGTAGLAYLLGWWSWFATPGAYLRDWALRHPGEGLTWLPDPLRSWVHYHAQMWDFHTHLDSEHTYEAPAWGWLIQWRPTSFFYETPEPAAELCGAAKCSQAITSLGNPVIWWLGTVAVLAALWWVVRRRDGVAAAALTGLAAAWLPWLAFPDRTIFTFYTIVLLPFVALVLVWSTARFLGHPDHPVGEAVVWRRAVVIVLAGLIVVVSAFFYPIWTGMVIPFRFWQLHMWLPTWV